MEMWHSFSIEETEKKLNTSIEKGLSRHDAEDRNDSEIRDGKRNRLPLYCGKKKNILSLVFTPFASITYILYLTVALFAFLKGDGYFGAWAIILLLCQGILLGILNARSVRAKERANDYFSPTVRLLRSGAVKYTDGRNIARGDIILLSAGDVIPCDARLIESESLIVDEFLFDVSEQRLNRRRVIKNSQKIYDGNTSVGLTDAQNIILAGSVIQSGSGRAIVFSVGEDTILASHLNDGEMSADIKRPLGIGKLLSWVHKICIFAAMLILVITLMGMFTIRGQSLHFVFLMAISSMLYISATLSDVWSRIFFSTATERLHKSIIVKNNKVFDILTGFSDVLILGRAGLTDGELHVSGVFAAGRGLDTSMIEAKPDRVHHLCEYLYIYLKACGRQEREQIRQYEGALDSFMSNVGYDREAADLRLSWTYSLDHSEQNATDEPSINNVYISVTHEDTITAACKYLRVGDMSAPIDDNLRERIAHYVSEREGAGDKLLFVVSEEMVDGIRTGDKVLEGILALEEHTVEGLSETLEQYKEMGVTLTALMTDEGAESIKYLVASGIISSVTDKRIAYASQFAHEGFDITHGIGEYRAYLGFEVSEYSALASRMREMGRVVASYGVDDRFSGVAMLCDVSATCNCIKYDSQKYKDSYFEKFPDMGRENSSLASQRGRIISGLLVERKEQGGGLQGIIHAADASSSAYINLSYYLKYFAIQSAGLISLAVLSALSGVTLINPVQISALYLFISVLGAYFFASNQPRREMLRQSKRGYIALPEVMIRANLPKIITRACAGALFLIISVALMLFGVIGREGIAFSSFISLFAVSVADMYAIGREYSEGNERKKKVNLFATISAVIVAVILIAAVGIRVIDIIFKGEYAYFTREPEKVIGVIYGGRTDLLSLILIPVFTVICKVLDRLCDKFYLRLRLKVRKTK